MNGSFARAMLVGCVSAFGGLCLLVGGLLVVLIAANFYRGEALAEQGPVMLGALAFGAGSALCRWLSRFLARAAAA